MGLLGLMHAANEHDRENPGDDEKSGSDAPHKDGGLHDRSSRRSRIPPDMWQDTLSLLCDDDFGVRADYAEALVYYLTHEMPKHGEDSEATKHRPETGETSGKDTALVNSVLFGGDSGGKLLHAIHSYLYILLSCSPLAQGSSVSESSDSSPDRTLPAFNIQPATPLTDSHPDVARSLPLSQGNPPRSRKLSMAFRLIQDNPNGLQGNSHACLTDYSNTLLILTTIHQQLPIRGLVTGLPMLLALDGGSDLRVAGARTNPRVCGIKLMLAELWKVLGSVWQSTELAAMGEKVG